LLVSDDPDDHHSFTEAIAKISEDIVVLIVIDREKAMELLLSKTHLPDFLIIDISMDGYNLDRFLGSIRGQVTLSRIPILTYGEPSEYAEIENRQSLMFFANAYEFSKLQNVLRDFLEGRLN
jgi:hypothetical protein